jgi:hypothetical protein
MHIPSELTSTAGTFTIMAIKSRWILTSKTLFASLASQVVPQNKKLCLGESVVEEAAGQWLIRALVSEMVLIARLFPSFLILPI